VPAGGSRQYEFELAAKVVVEPAVKERIGAGGRHAKKVKNGVGDSHQFLVPRKSEWIIEIEKKIKDVQRKPGDTEDDGYGHQ